MSAFPRPIALPVPFTRSVAVAALIGAVMLASPLTAARGDSAINGGTLPATAGTMPVQAGTQDHAAAAAVTAKHETVEHRITSLHAALQITPKEEARWTKVAMAMRSNAAAMQKLVAAKADRDAQSMTAVDDLRNYERFARVHADGLKRLTASFETLYAGMPVSQRKVADQVFQSFGHKGAPSRS
jgi:protein CpxP